MERNWDGKERRAEAVNIPYPILGVIITLVIQTIGGVWWASSMNTNMKYLNDGQSKLEKLISESSALRYTSIDASRDWAANERRINVIEGTIERNNKLLTDLQIKNGITRDNKK